MPPQEKHPMLTTRRDQFIPFSTNGIEVSLVGENRCSDPVGLLGQFHALFIEQHLFFDSLFHSGRGRTLGCTPLVGSDDCNLFLQDPSRLSAEDPNYCGRFGVYCIKSGITTTLTNGVSMKITDTGSRLGYTTGDMLEAL
jgi:hypothetical protein